MDRVRALFLCLLVVLSVGWSAAGCAGSEESAEASQPPARAVADAAERTRAADSGRFVVTTEVGFEDEARGQMFRTTARGAFDHAREAMDVSIDLGEVIEAGTQLLEGVPREMVAEVVQIRTIGPEHWIRGETGSAWRSLTADELQMLTMDDLYSPDDLLGLLRHIHPGVERSSGGVFGAARYSGWIDVAGITGVTGEALGGPMGRTLDAVPAGLVDEMVRFDAWVDNDGYITRLLIELDFAPLSQAFGEEAPEGMVFRWVLDLTDLDQPVNVPTPDA